MRRNKLDRMFDVVKAARNVGITKLMYTSNVNCTTLRKEILPILIEHGLIKVERRQRISKRSRKDRRIEGRALYTQTEIGIEFIRLIRAAYALIGDVWK